MDCTGRALARANSRSERLATPEEAASTINACWPDGNAAECGLLFHATTGVAFSLISERNRTAQVTQQNPTTSNSNDTRWCWSIAALRGVNSLADSSALKKNLIVTVRLSLI